MRTPFRVMARRSRKTASRRSHHIHHVEPACGSPIRKSDDAGTGLGDKFQPPAPAVEVPSPYVVIFDRAGWCPSEIPIRLLGSCRRWSPILARDCHRLSRELAGRRFRRGMTFTMTHPTVVRSILPIDQ